MTNRKNAERNMMQLWFLFCLHFAKNNNNNRPFCSSRMIQCYFTM